MSKKVLYGKVGPEIRVLSQFDTLFHRKFEENPSDHVPSVKTGIPQPEETLHPMSISLLMI